VPLEAAGRCAAPKGEPPEDGHRPRQGPTAAYHSTGSKSGFCSRSVPCRIVTSIVYLLRRSHAAHRCAWRPAFEVSSMGARGRGEGPRPLKGGINRNGSFTDAVARQPACSAVSRRNCQTASAKPRRRPPLRLWRHRMRNADVPLRILWTPYGRAMMVSWAFRCSAGDGMTGSSSN
jgi:hypothetical protein